MDKTTAPLCPECGFPIAACNRIAILTRALERIRDRCDWEWAAKVAAEALEDE